MKNLKEQYSLKEIRTEFNFKDPFLLEEQLYEDEILNPWKLILKK